MNPILSDLAILCNIVSKKSNTIFSGLIWQVLLLFMYHLIFELVKLESLEHDYIRSLKSQSHKQMPS